MDFTDIEFTEWQIHKIRVALNKYRIKKARLGKLPKLPCIRDEIIFSDVNKARYKQDPDLVFEAEALRRFAEFKSVLKLDKLQDVTRFLLDDGILHIDMLDESKSGLMEFLALHEYLSNDSEEARKFVERLDGLYIAQKEAFNRAKTLKLRLVADPSKTFLRVDELVRIAAANAGQIGGNRVRPKDDMIRTNRTGYAFPMTADNRLHIFLNGVVPGSRATYVQACGLCEDSLQNGIYFMRSDGEPVLEKFSLAQYHAGVPALENIYFFTSAQGASSHDL